MGQEAPLTPEQQLAALNQAKAGMDQALAYGGKVIGWYSIILGLALGALACLLQFFTPQEHFTAFIVLMAVFGVVVVVQSLVYGKLYRSMPSGFSRIYLLGLIMSIVLYAISISLLGSLSGFWLLPVLAGLVVAAPLLIAGGRMMSK